MSQIKVQTPLKIATLIISDTRNKSTDQSGPLLIDLIETSGHHHWDYQIVSDNKYQIRAAISAWVASPYPQVILCSGGTGFSPRDVTPQAVFPLLDVEVPGFAELFRALSISEIGHATIQSRALAGIANQTLIACLPGSPSACRLAWQKILHEQLDAHHLPCNFVNQLKPSCDEE